MQKSQQSHCLLMLNQKEKMFSVIPIQLIPPSISWYRNLYCHYLINTKLLRYFLNKVLKESTSGKKRPCAAHLCQSFPVWTLSTLLPAGWSPQLVPNIYLCVQQPGHGHPHQSLCFIHGEIRSTFFTDQKPKLELSLQLSIGHKIEHFCFHQEGIFFLIYWPLSTHEAEVTSMTLQEATCISMSRVPKLKKYGTVNPASHNLHNTVI